MKTRIKINPDFSHLHDYLTKLPDQFEQSGETIFKGRNEIKRAEAPDGSDLVIKHFGHLPSARRIIYTLGRSKARRAFENGLKFISLGFDTPTPVAYIETYHNGILADAFFVSLYSDHQPLFIPLVENDRFDTALANDVAGLMADLHDKGAIHGDPNLNNILYKYADDGKTTFSLIDTNRSRFRRHLSTRRCLKNLMRVSHRRDLMRHVVGRYASLRHLDPVATVDRVLAMLDRFERNRRIRHRLKAIILRRPVD